MNKRGEGMPIELIIIFGIAIVAAIIVILWLGGGFSIFKSFTSIQLGEAGDLDHDDIANRQDACKCQAGPVRNVGCPEGIDPDNVSISDRYKGCPQEYCDQFKIKGCPDNPHT
ncbi:MAG: hypothetical protein KAT77_02125 [Nanoarchaeota archaeon]|nr:hypothetical protein [Nanoarchaeota archaeon]